MKRPTKESMMNRARTHARRAAQPKALPKNMLWQSEADAVRAKLAKERANYAGVMDFWPPTDVTEFGTVEIIKATGRATCRCCGQRIAKGVEALRFPYDFTGSGSWTAQDIQIHAEHCTRPTEGGVA